MPCPGYPSNSQLPAQQLTHTMRSTETADDDSMTTELHSSPASPVPLTFQFNSLFRPCQHPLFCLLLEAALPTPDNLSQISTGALLTVMTEVLPLMLVVNRLRTTRFVPTGAHDERQIIGLTGIRLRSTVDA